MTQLTFRNATRNDLEDIIAMLADDKLGKQREDFQLPLPQPYIDAFSTIDQDPHNELIVACLQDEIVGVLQLTYIPYLTYQGSWRALIEGVRIKSTYRGQGFGETLFRWAIERAQEKNCHMLQLTSDKQRPEAISFYKKLGFVASHEGLKLKL